MIAGPASICRYQYRTTGNSTEGHFISPGLLLQCPLPVLWLFRAVKAAVDRTHQKPSQDHSKHSRFAKCCVFCAACFQPLQKLSEQGLLRSEAAAILSSSRRAPASSHAGRRAEGEGQRTQHVSLSCDSDSAKLSSASTRCQHLVSLCCPPGLAQPSRA